MTARRTITAQVARGIVVRTAASGASGAACADHLCRNQIPGFDVVTGVPVQSVLAKRLFAKFAALSPSRWHSRSGRSGNQ